MVPVIKRADTLDFAAFHAAYETLVEKARSNKLMPDDFAGATMSLTNPGGLGTVASVPRLMAGQGSIIAVGAIGYPVEFRAVADERLREFGISKVMTVTSTYDHRVIQGAESGAFLATLDHLLQGDEGFYQLIEESLQLSAESYELVKAAPGPSGRNRSGPIAPEMLYHVAAAMALVKAFRMHGHLAAHLDPLGTPPIGDPALEPEARSGSRPRPRRRSRPRCSASRCPGGPSPSHSPISRPPTAAPWPTRSSTSPPTRSGCGCGRRSRAARTGSRWPRRAARGCFGGSPRWSRLEKFLHKAYLGQKRFSIEGVDMLVPMLDLTIERAAELGRPRRGDRHGAPRPAQRAGPHGGAAVRDDLRRVRGRPAGRGRAAHARGRHRRREVPPRRRRRLRHDRRQGDHRHRSRPTRATSSS